MLAATVLGVGVGIVLTRARFKKYTNIVMYIVSLGQTTPSMVDVGDRAGHRRVTSTARQWLEENGL